MSIKKNYFDLNKNRFVLDNLQLFADDGGDDGAEGDPQEETVSKALFDKKTKELAELKRQLKAKQTDEEKALEIQKEKDAELEELKTFRQRSILENSLLTNGIDKEEVKGLANVILSGDVEKIGKSIGTIYTKGYNSLQTEINELKMAGIDKPSGSDGNSDKEITLENFKKMTIDERIALKNSNPELFKQFMKNK